MAKPVSDLQIMTANRLHDGEVVFLAPDLTWVEQVNRSWVARTEEGCSVLTKEGEVAEQRNHIVEPYLIAVREQDGVIEPLHHREKMRTLGPSVRLDLGKQAHNDGKQASDDDKPEAIALAS